MTAMPPLSRAEMAARGWDALDFVFVSGDAYVDHPSFGVAIISRLLESRGYRVGIVAQPQGDDDFRELGVPRLAFLVSSGNLDSQLNRYTAAKRPRSRDNYSDGGRVGLRPEHATTVYAQTLRRLFGDTPIIIGGIEASLRRFVHYDYWRDEIMPSILIASGADLLVFGMGERQMVALADDLRQGVAIGNVQDIAGTCYAVPDFDYAYDYVKLPSLGEVRAERRKFAEMARVIEEEQDPIRGRKLAQECAGAVVVQNPPALPLTSGELDAVCELPYTRRAHPRYTQGVPALGEVQFSLTSHRGCFGGCHFCAIASHQGRVIQRRSDESLLREAASLTRLPDFKGYIHDVGGPTANFHQPSCAEQMSRGTCRGKPCLSPQPCANLAADHQAYLGLLRKLRAVPGVRKVFVRSGVRYDYLLLAEDGEEFLRELCEHHVSGQLKVAPEHMSPKVTRLMGKAPPSAFVEFAQRYAAVNARLGKRQYLVPYFMSSHPGATLADALALAQFMRAHGWRVRQVQDFIPTPGTISTAMYVSGVNPLTGERVHVARSAEERRRQRALLLWWEPRQAPLVRDTLRRLGREDLIGLLLR